MRRAVRHAHLRFCVIGGFGAEISDDDDAATRGHRDARPFHIYANIIDGRRDLLNFDRMKHVTGIA